MATAGEKLADSLLKLKALQDSGITAIKASDISRIHRERLLANGFIKEVVKGWYISVSHNEQQGDSSSWYTSFWDFCSRYLEDRYGSNYCISAEQSLILHSGNNTVPNQLIVRSPKGNNLPTQLLSNTSLFVIQSSLPNESEIELYKGVRIYNLASSIVYSSASIYTKQALEARTALMMIKDASELLSLLLDGGHSTIAGRLVGAYRNLSRDKIADNILKTMKSVSYDVRVSDPFAEPNPIPTEQYAQSPYVNRIRLMWEQMRGTVIALFPTTPSIPENVEPYMKSIDEIFTTDAYHSLSIEKYKVSPELIRKVMSGDWNTEENEKDQEQKNAMAARGYWQAFNAVKESIGKIFKGENAGRVADNDHSDWYRELFAPSVAVGLLKPSDLAGYRLNQVYIGGSQHTPINKDALRDVMPLLFELLEQEENAAVRAVLGHFFFVYTHPYMDGNGRMGRFLMNVMFASGGYPWTVIPVEYRDKYMSALEEASVKQNIRPFAEFIHSLVEASLNGEKLTKTI